MSNSLASVHPELIPEWSERNLPLTPDKITFGSNKRVWWKGACGHEWETSVKARSKGEKCPICSGARVIEGINDLVTLKPLLAQEWSEKNKLKPTEVSVASHKKIIWKCKHGHEWEASVKSRTINGTGCPYCSHNKVLAGFNDLASQYPDIAAEWSDRNLPLLPTMVTAFANSKAWWKCRDCGNEWYTLISTRAGGSRCPYCSGYTLLKGFNDLATTHPDIAAEWSERNYPLMPDEVNAKSRHNVWWKCKTCGNEWKSVINARVKGTVCPVCADRTVLAGYNDLATTDRKLLAEWDYEKNSLLPTQVSRRSMKRVWWKCSLGHSWKAKISDRTIIGEKCTVCEKEYRSVFPGLAVAYYANQKGLKVQLGSDKLLGIPLETYIPSEKLAIEFTNGSEHMEVLKSHLCKQRNIKLVKLPFKTTETETEYKGYADLKKAIFACTLTNLAMLLPFCVTVMIFNEILTPFVSGGEIQWNHIWLLWGVGIISAVLVFLAAKNDYRKTYIASYKESNTTRLRIAEHLRKLPMSFFNTKDLSELTTNMMSDCSSMESLLSSTIPPLIANGITVTLTCILLAFFDWRLALCVFCTVPIAFLVIWMSRKHQKTLFEKQVNAKLAASDQVQEYLEGMKIIKSCGLSGSHFKTLDKALLTMKKIAIKVEMAVGVFSHGKSPFLRLWERAAALFCCRPLITYQQGQTGLSTVGAAHSLAVDWLGWLCYSLIIGFPSLSIKGQIPPPVPNFATR